MPLLVGLTGYVMAGHGDGRGRGAGKLLPPRPSRTPVSPGSGIKSAPTLKLQDPRPRTWLEKCQTLDTPHIEVLFLGLEVGQEGVRCGDKGLVS